MEKERKRFRGKALECTRRTISNLNVSLYQIQTCCYVTPPSLVGPFPSLYAKRAIDFKIHHNTQSPLDNVGNNKEFTTLTSQCA